MTSNSAGNVSMFRKRIGRLWRGRSSGQNSADADTFWVSRVVYIVFSAREHMFYSALYAIARPSVRLSVCLSVRHTGGSVKDGRS